jgi:hypothetical protein
VIVVDQSAFHGDFEQSEILEEADTVFPRSLVLGVVIVITWGRHEELVESIDAHHVKNYPSMAPAEDVSEVTDEEVAFFSGEKMH